MTAVLLLGALLQDPRIHADADRGYTMPVPGGWSVNATGDDVAVLRMGAGDATFALRIQTPMRALNGGIPTVADLAGQLRAANAKKWKECEQIRLESSGAAALVEMAWTDGERKMRCLQYLVADPSRLCVLTWIAPAELFDGLRAAIESASRGFALKK